MIAKEITKLHETFYRNDVDKIDLFKTPIKGELTIIISDKQTRGRGQHGKKWVSNKGNLFFSIFFIINKKILTSRLVISNLRIIKKILSNYIKSKIKIKRPNDITVNKKKICGKKVLQIKTKDLETMSK